MTSYWTRAAISCLTAFSLTAALVVGVFSQSHALADIQAQSQTHEVEPCAGHMAVPEVSEDNCLTLCDAADMHQLMAVLSDRGDEYDTEKFEVVYGVPDVFGLKVQRGASQKIARAPPSLRIYLTTQRIRI